MSRNGALLRCQTVEMSLRALWLHERGEGAPWTGSLTELGDGLGAPAELRPVTPPLPAPGP